MMLPDIKGVQKILNKVKVLILFLIVYRIGAHIPVPGVDPSKIQDIFSGNNSLFGLFNTFSGGALSNLSLFSLGIFPYITASIVIQILSVVHPKINQLKKDGPSGQRTLTFYTRFLTLLVGISQGLTATKMLASYGALTISPFMVFQVVLTLVTGTMILVWVGEQLTEIQLGNGSSLLIFSGIVSGLPGVIFGAFEKVRIGTLSPLSFLISFAVILACILFIVYIERAQRRVPVHYTRRLSAGQSAKPQRSDLPLKINMSGVMPVIFATTVVVTPATVFQSFGIGLDNSFILFMQENLSSGKPLFMLTLAMAILGFSFFSAAMYFNPKDIADEIKKSGGVIQGLRPGPATAAYIDSVMSRLTLVGSIYLTMVALLPEVMNYFGTIPFKFGGTSLLIVVVVVMEFMNQVQSHLFTAQYANVLKKYQPKPNISKK
jgi:preprotein translocase subunit SecY